MPIVSLFSFFWILAVAQPQETPKASLPDDLDRDFKLLDKFDTLDTSKMPFVRVATGAWSRTGNQSPVNSYKYGFLLSDHAGKFTVRYLDLIEGTLDFSPVGTPECERRGYEKLDLSIAVEETVQQLADYRKKVTRSEWFRYPAPYRPLQPGTEALLLARVCVQQGRPELVEQLIKGDCLSVANRKNLDDDLHRVITLRFSDRRYSRLDLLKMTRLWLETFSNDYYAQSTKEQESTLARMVEEDRVAESRPAADAPLSRQEQIQQWIHDLRDQARAQIGEDVWSQGFYLSGDTSGPEAANEPSRKLIDAGLEAVPALLEKLQDTTLTRCVFFFMRHGSSTSVWKVGNFVDEILTQITTIRAYGKPEEKLKLWRDWYDRTKSKGEAGALKDLVASGKDHEVLAAAKRLLKISPQSLDVVIAGVRRINNRAYRNNLLDLLDQHWNPRVEEFMRVELEKGGFVSSRVAAAEILWKHGISDGVDFFKAQWSSGEFASEKQDANVPAAVADFDQELANREMLESSARLLLECGQLDALRILTKRISKGGPTLQKAVFSVLDHSDLEELLKTAKKGDRRAMEEEIENMLMVCLDDFTAIHGSYSFSYLGKYVDLTNPRQCDLVACQFVRFWPKNYTFDPTSVSLNRDRQLIQLRNQVRKSRGLPLLPVPELPPPPKPEEAFKKVVEWCIQDTDAVARARNVELLTKASLRSLPWLIDRLSSIDKTLAVYKELEQLAIRMSAVVANVKFETGSYKAPESIQSLVRNFEQKPLDPEAVVQFLIQSLDALGSETGTIEFHVEREGVGSGLFIRAKMQSSGGRHGNTVEHNESIMSNGKEAHMSFGSGTRSHCLSESAYLDGTRKLREALTTGYKSLEVTFSLTLH